MNPYSFQLVASLLGIAFVVLVILPRLKRFLEMKFLSMATHAKLGVQDHLPGPVSSPQSYIEASKSVQRALAYGSYATRWSLKVVEVSQPIEKAIRIIGNVATPAITGSLVPNSSADSKMEHIHIKLEVDVKQRGQGSHITWHFYPSDPALFERQQQISDFRLHLLLLRTNYHLMKELEKAPAQAHV